MKRFIHAWECPGTRVIPHSTTQQTAVNYGMRLACFQYEYSRSTMMLHVTDHDNQKHILVQDAAVLESTEYRSSFSTQADINLQVLWTLADTLLICSEYV